MSQFNAFATTSRLLCQNQKWIIKKKNGLFHKKMIIIIPQKNVSFHKKMDYSTKKKQMDTKSVFNYI